MEYNVPMIISENHLITRARAVNLEFPYDPCPKIQSRLQASCYYELGQWWDKVFDSDYAYMDSLCEKIPGNFQEACFLGLGNVIGPSNNYNVEKVTEKCRLLRTTSAQEICLNRASWTFKDSPFEAVGYTVCASLSPDKQKTCLPKP